MYVAPITNTRAMKVAEDKLNTRRKKIMPTKNRMMKIRAEKIPRKLMLIA